MQEVGVMVSTEYWAHASLCPKWMEQPKLQALNHCWMFLKVFLLSNIVLGSGDYIATQFWDLPQQANSPLSGHVWSHPHNIHGHYGIRHYPLHCTSGKIKGWHFHLGNGTNNITHRDGFTIWVLTPYGKLAWLSGSVMVVYHNAPNSMVFMGWERS